MKASKRIIIWIFISLFLQVSLYLYLDIWYFAPAHNVKFTNISSDDKSKVIKPKVTLSESAKNISVSYDCSYTAYFDNGIVKVVDTSTGKQRNLSFSEGASCLSYEWLPDANIMMIAERVTYKGRKVIKFYSYDAEKQENRDTDIYSGGVVQKVNYMDSNSSKDKVDFENSTLTGVLYGKISYNNSYSKVYRLDRNETLTRVTTTTSNIGNLAVASDDDQLAYEDLSSGRIRTTYKGKTISINGSYNLSLVGTDSDDNFYVGIGKGKVNKIYYGKLADNSSTWKELNLNKTVNTNEIFVTQNGNVFILDKTQTTMLNVKNNKSYNFSGNFIGVNDNSIVYEENYKLKLESIK